MRIRGILSALAVLVGLGLLMLAAAGRIGGPLPL